MSGKWESMAVISCKRAAVSFARDCFVPVSIRRDTAFSLRESSKSESIWFTLMPMPIITYSTWSLSLSMDISVKMPLSLRPSAIKSFSHLI